MHRSPPICSWIIACFDTILYSWQCFWSCDRAYSLGWKATLHMNDLRLLYCWHDTALIVAFTFSFPDNQISRCPKPSEGGTLEQFEAFFTAVETLSSGAIFFVAISLHVRPFWCNAMMTVRLSWGNHCKQFYKQLVKVNPTPVFILFILFTWRICKLTLTLWTVLQVRVRDILWDFITSEVCHC